MKIKKTLLSILAIMALGQSAQAGGGDDPLLTMLKLDQFEIRNNDENLRVWEGSFWVGHDINKLYVYSTGEATKNGLESSQNEFVYSRAIAPFWDAQVGLTYDKNANASRTWAELAIAGLAPYWFELDFTGYVGEEGRTALNIEAEYELLITQRLILQPRLEADLYGKDDPGRGIGPGLSSASAGIRLRYEIRREFAPYVGVEWAGSYGDTADYARAAGLDSSEVRAVAGLRFWF